MEYVDTAIFYEKMVGGKWTRVTTDFGNLKSFIVLLYFLHLFLFWCERAGNASCFLDVCGSGIILSSSLKNYIHFILFNIYLYLYSSNLSGIRFLDRALRETAVGNALCFSNLHVCLLIPDTFLFEADAPHTLHWRSTCPLQNPLIRLLGVSRRARPGVGTLPARRSDTVNKPCASWSEGGRSDSFSEGWRVGGSGSVPAQPGWCQSAHHPPTAHTPPLRLPSLHVGNQHSFVKAN